MHPATLAFLVMWFVDEGERGLRSFTENEHLIAAYFSSEVNTKEILSAIFSPSSVNTHLSGCVEHVLLERILRCPFHV